MSAWSRVGLSLLVLASPGRCSRHMKGAPDAGVDAGTVIVDAGPPAPPPPPKVDPAIAANATALERARNDLVDVQWMVAHNVTLNPSKPDGEVASKCDANGIAEARLTAASPADLRATLDQTKALCGYDVPLVTASEALDQLRNAQSQASRPLSCNVAKTELDKARLVKQRDIKLLRIDVRRDSLCSKSF